MKTTVSQIIFVVFTTLFSYVKSTCSSFETIDPDNYDYTYYSIDNESSRPLGFTRGLVSYNQPQLNTCSTLSGVSGHSVEIMFETVPSSTLCVRYGGESACAAGTYTSCKPATSDTIQVEFYCDSGSGCSESDVLFWYRITKSPEIDNDGYWCFDQNGQYPESLRPLPTALPDPVTTHAPSSAQSLSANINLFISIMALLFCR